MNFYRYFQLALMTLCLTSQAVFSSAATNAEGPGLLLHPNGALAWNYDVFSPFFHQNNKIAWQGLNHPNRNFYYDNGEIAWRGFTYNESIFSYDNSALFHRNGKKLWRGASKKDAGFMNEYCTIYHNNGTKAWEGALNKETLFSYDSCTLYHNNGIVAWRGATSKETSSYDATTFYHANGAVAWRGYFAKDNSDIQACGLFYDNGKLAWSGRAGDPLFDINGFVQSNSVTGVNFPIGNDSWLYVAANGDRTLNLSIGDGSFLQFTTLNDDPAIILLLGPGYKLNFFPHSGNKPQFICYDLKCIINYKK